MIHLALLLCVVAGVNGGSVTVGNTRITALSASLVRIEPKGPKGFEDRDTFNVIGRSHFSDGLPISLLNQSKAGSWLQTSAYLVYIPKVSDPQCHSQSEVDAGHPLTRAAKYPSGLHTASAAECCAACSAEPDCTGYTYAEKVAGVNCWPFATYNGTVAHSGRTFGSVSRAVPKVTTLDGQLLWTADAPTPVRTNLLHWPSPLVAASYAFEDRPRFVTPPWGPTPIPPGATVPRSLQDTNGYDFTNDVEGDTYIFLLGSNLEGWWQSRAHFLQLTGPTPTLPDWAYGVWCVCFVPICLWLMGVDAGTPGTSLTLRHVPRMR